MRLGAYKCNLEEGSRLHEIYGHLLIWERHRHRYEFNNQFLSEYEAHGMHAVGINRDSNLVEIITLPDHPWFIGVQFHPEYSSTVLNPHPLFMDFVKTAIQKQNASDDTL